ncbi:hypothetical protein D3870_18660 [Noviherbaspirillum cavernae]|uniref:Uncharacterized protein n=1 Tax=Noviherbaspirillum cavernae TaxID=2320862 RepID=A0A418WV97_9BURK|nr:hypothetical protein D3870_18660 [Noviherbaspirillum cavernae]
MRGGTVTLIRPTLLTWNASLKLCFRRCGRLAGGGVSMPASDDKSGYGASLFHMVFSNRVWLKIESASGIALRPIQLTHMSDGDGAIVPCAGIFT